MKPPTTDFNFQFNYELFIVNFDNVAHDNPSLTDSSHVESVDFGELRQSLTVRYQIS